MTGAHDLATLIGEAALDQARWTDLCDGLARASGGAGTLIIPKDKHNRPGGLIVSPSLAENTQVYIKGGWYLNDLREQRHQAVWSNTGYVTDTHLVAPEEMATSPYYNEFLIPLGIKWFLGVVIQAPHGSIVFSIQRAVENGPFEPEDIAAVMRHRGQLETAVAVAQHLGRARVDGAVEVLSARDKCVLALDRSGRVRHASPGAEASIAGGLRISTGRLSPVDPTVRPALDRFLGQLQATADHGVVPNPLPVRRLDGRAPIILHAARLTDATMPAFASATMLIIVHDPDVDLDIPASLLVDLYDFTPAEARLAVALVRGGSAADHARSSGISAVTARNHLQSILRKSGTHTKAEFVTTAMRLLPAL